MDDFKETFKYFKRNRDCKLFQDVVNLDLQNTSKGSHEEFKNCDEYNKCDSCIELGLLPHQQWHISTLKNRSGLFFIKNPFTTKGQQKWIRKCLELYPRKPSVTNLDLHYKSVDEIWSLQEDPNPIKSSLIKKLSWTTLGYHHNWETKIYDPTSYSEFPECLANLTKHIASSLHFKTFKPEAAILNYYNDKSTLGIHNDHSEVELNEPIISISFGQSAIFLVGSELKTEKPIAVFLKSGDIVILSGASRLAYHAVPSIIQDPVCNRYCASENNDETWKCFQDYIEKHRINISVRQVYPDDVTK